MRVLLTHPFFWPYVRRGAEREVHDIGARLAVQGHQMRLVTSMPRGLTRGRDIDGVRVRYLRTPVPRRLARRGVTTMTAFAAVAAVAARTTRADLVHCFYYSDAWGVTRGRRHSRRNRPVILKLTGTVRAHLIDRLPVDARMFREALSAADAVWCNSAFAREEMSEFGVPMQVVPAGVDLTVFRPGPSRIDRPTVFAPSASADPRKRFADLVAAWPGVLARVPDAALRVAGMTGPETLTLLDSLPPSARRTVHLLGEVDDTTLAREYASAWVSVTPALYEALGLTTLESLAAGTPVVAASSGAAPELICDPITGRLFPPLTPEACADAIAMSLDAPPAAVVAAACRAAAGPYDWDRIIPRILAGYDEVLRR